MPHEHADDEKHYISRESKSNVTLNCQICKSVETINSMFVALTPIRISF